MHTFTAQNVTFDEDAIWVSLSDGRILGVPLAWFPRLLCTTLLQRTEVKISPFGSRKDALEQDISVAGLIAGRRDMAGVGAAA